MRISPGILILSPLALVAQGPSVDPLGDLLNTPITVASTSPRTMRTSPGVVTRITREEIQTSGARDLIDVLRLVPGLDFAYDMQGVVGLSVRGLWAYEGKALLLWNGIEMPDLLLGNTAYNHRFPVDQIKRIEVIRGPGSAMYGGTAELAVIKIITLDDRELGDQGGGGIMAGGGSALIRAQGQLMGSTRIGEGRLVFGTAFEQGVASTETYDPWGEGLLDARTTTRLHAKFFHANYTWDGLQAQALIEDYLYGDPNYPETTRFQSQNLNLKYTAHVGDVELTPELSYRRHTPWNYWDVEGWHTRTIQGMRYTLGAAWMPLSAWSISGGLEHRTDYADVGPDSPANYSLDRHGLMSFSTHASAAFFQAEYAGVLNVTVGGRYERHSHAGSAFVPRFALTKVADPWHFKLLYAHAFRTPSIGNTARPVVPGERILPEKTRTLEVEAGRQFGSAILTVNLFDTHLDKPIIWVVLPSGLGNRNGGAVHSRGGEVDFRWRQPWGFLNATYGYHQGLDHGATDWSVPGEARSFLGLPNHKAALLAGIHLTPSLSLNPSVTFLGPRWGYDWDHAADDLTLRHYSATTLLNLNLAYSHQHWTVSLGVFDLLDQNPAFLQTYKAEVPLKGPGRELVLKLRYGF